MENFDKTIEVIKGELKYSQNLVDEKDYNKKAPVSAEILMMEEYLKKAREAWVSNTGDEAALHQIRKVTSMGIRVMNNHGAFPR